MGFDQVLAGILPENADHVSVAQLDKLAIAARNEGHEAPMRRCRVIATKLHRRQIDGHEALERVRALR